MKDQKLVFISGGSSGIGFALARQYVQSGDNILICARNEEKLSRAIKDLRSDQIRSDQIIEKLSIDISNYSDVLLKLSQTQDQLGVPDILINCAGIARTQFFQDLNIQDFVDLININYLGTVYLTKTLLPGMISRGNGHIVIVSSFVGFFNSIGYSAYGASKYALRGLADALRLELKPKGIKVHIAFPPDTDTPQLAEERAKAPAEVILMNSGVKTLSPEKVASSIIRGIVQNHFSITPGFETQLLWYLFNGSGFLQRGFLDLLYHRVISQIDHNQAQKL